MADALSRKKSSGMATLLTSQKSLLEDIRKLDVEVVIEKIEA